MNSATEQLPVVEGTPVLRKTKNGNIYVRIWDGVHNSEIQFHAESDVKGIVKALHADRFHAEQRDYGPDKKWTEYLGPRCRVTFRPTGKTENGSAVFATAEDCEAVPLCTSVPGIDL